MQIYNNFKEHRLYVPFAQDEEFFYIKNDCVIKKTPHNCVEVPDLIKTFEYQISRGRYLLTSEYESINLGLDGIYSGSQHIYDLEKLENVLKDRKQRVLLFTYKKM
jgi:hypothetical protein